MILLLSVRLLDDRYHGLTANGEQSEWPPSPFRLFQAIVAGNAHGETISNDVADALRWLETLAPPDILVPCIRSGRELLTYVLNNSVDRSRTEKRVRPTLFNGDRLIEFCWQFDTSESDSQSNAEALLRGVQHIRAFGWGIDLAIGHGKIIENLPEKSVSRVQFSPAEDANAIGSVLRCPLRGSFMSLQECFAQYLGRFKSSESTVLESSGPTYRLQTYVTASARPHAIFRLLDENEDAYRYPHAKLVHISGMVRHLAIKAMDPQEGGDPPPWITDPAEWVCRVVRGKRDESSPDAHRQFSYVPLPSIGHEHADAMIRNVMVIAPLGMDRELAYLAERLNGEILKPEGQFESCESDSKPLISGRIELQKFSPPSGRFIAERYLGTSRTWHTVTPIILDGHNKKSKSDRPEEIARETEKLIRKALARAGIETPCEFAWQSIPFLKNCLSAHKYDRNRRHTGYHRPERLKNLTAVHVRLTFTHPVPGPITLGAGRHFGLGLFAAIP